MVSAKTKLTNPMGMHMRPANLFVSEMAKFPCDVKIIFGGKEVNGKSIMNLMAACMKTGSEIEIFCDGPQEQDALDKAVALIESGLGE